MQSNESAKEQDHELAGQIIRWEQEGAFPSVVAFVKAVGVDRVTIYKVFKGDPTVKAATLHLIEKVFGWPRGSVDAIRRHDLDWLEERNFPKDPLMQIRALTTTFYHPHADKRVAPVDD